VISRLVTRLAVWRASRLKEAFIAATKDPWGHQQGLLAELLGRDRDTEYGRRFCFSGIQGPEAFRRAVPLITFEDVAAEVERMAGGEPDVLVSSRDRLLRFCLTSGTTGRPKTIPVTASFLKSYKSGWAAWVWAALEDYPVLIEQLDTHKLLAFVSPASSGATPGGYPTGAITGLTTSAQARSLVRAIAAPQACSAIEGFSLRTYAQVRFALEADVGHISTPNPSTLLKVAELMASRSDELIKDLRDGTCQGLEAMSSTVKATLQSCLKPRPDRARLMERRAAGEGKLKPKDVWPNLTLLSCWMGGTLRLYLERLPESYGPIALRDLGLIASEGRMSLPLSDGGAGVLDLWSNVYEFIPEAEAEGPKPTTVWLPEVEVGQRYFLVLTNRAGLYRYQIQDCVEVVGRYGETPLIVFLNKGRSISSMTGEKLTEHQVLSAAESVFASSHPIPTRFTVCPAWADPPHYVLCLEKNEASQENELWLERAEAFDQALVDLNVEYASKRATGRLGALELRWMAPGTFSRLEDDRIAAADGRAEQVKHPYLVPDLDFLGRLEGPFGVEETKGADS
jgi:hypothetical protein